MNSSISGGYVGNAFINSNSYSATDAGRFILNGGTVDNLYLEYDSGYGAQLDFETGKINHLLISMKNDLGYYGNYYEFTDATSGTYHGGQLVYSQTDKTISKTTFNTNIDSMLNNFQTYIFEDCVFNAPIDVRKEVGLVFNDCVFNTDGSASNLYVTSAAKLIVNNCEFNGDITGKEVIFFEVLGMTLYKVSDEIPSKEDLIGKTYTLSYSDGTNEEIEILETDYDNVIKERQIISYGGYIPTIVIVSETTEEVPYSTGTYFFKLDAGADDYAYVSSLNMGQSLNTDEIDENFLRDINVNFGEKFGAINTIVLSRSADSDSVYYPEVLPEKPYEIKISDNQIMNGNNRADFLPDIYEKLNGLEFYTNDFVSTGICYLELGDRYNVKIGENVYSCVMLNDEVLITQGLQENVYTELPEQTETDYKHASKDDRTINQVYVIAKKNEGKIEEVVSSVDNTNKRINKVETSQTDTERKIEIITTNIDDNGNVTEVTTTTGFTFNANGMTIDDKSGFKAEHTANGTYYKDGNAIVGQYTKDGSKQKNLELFGIYSYGKESIDDTPMFVGQLYTDENGEEGFGHFYNGGDY